MAFRFRIAATTLIVAGLAFAPMAQARDWHGRSGGGGYHGGYHGGGRGFPVGAAIAGGLIGLGIGAAIAGSTAPPPVYYGYGRYGYGASPPVYYGY